MKNYCDREIYNEFLNRVNDLYEIAQEQSLFSLTDASLILKAKLQIIDGNFDEANILFDQAHFIGEEKGLKWIVSKIDNKKSAAEILRNGN
ncbi:MAG: hypothetical protein ACXAC2_08785 [Candidatus Kariarchaeaceae archaeon]